ncbi:MAG: MarR family transcriptional regulator, partial [Actinomycetota bacterium]
MTEETAPQTAPRWLDDRQQLAWRGLLAVVARAFPEFERTLKSHDLLAVHYQILAALSEAPDRTLRLSELAAGANTSQSRLTHRLRALVEHGDVAIESDPNDRRAKNATLTDAGMARLETVAPHHAEDVQR